MAAISQYWNGVNKKFDYLQWIKFKNDYFDPSESKILKDTLSSMNGILCSINANVSMIEYNTHMMLMRQDIVNVNVSVSGRY